MINGLKAIAKRAFGIADLDHWMDIAYSGTPTDSGYAVNETSAMRLPAVWACVDIISKAGSVLPGNVFRRIQGGIKPHQIDVNHYVQPIVHDLANPWMSAMEWRRMAICHYLLWGNHYSWIEWGADNKPKWMWPIDPARVTVFAGKGMGAGPRYLVRDSAGQDHEFPDWSILHFKNLSLDGLVGLSPVGMMREAVGLVGANQKSAASFHKSGFTNRLVLEYPQVLDQPQMDALKKSFNDAYAGLQNAHKAIILQNGMKATPISINPTDAQFLEQAKYSDSKIYQIYGVPGSLVGDVEKQTSWGTGVEQMGIGFVTYTLLPIMNNLETVIELKLMPDYQKSHFVEYELKGLMRGDTTARSAWHRSMIEMGVYSPNDVLRYENEDPYPGGDVYRRPLNMQFVNQKGDVVLETKPETKDAPKEQDNEQTQAS